MPVQDWQLTTYQSAAFAMCQRLGESPDSIRLDSDGVLRKAWEVYARRMAEHTILVETMRGYGFPT